MDSIIKVQVLNAYKKLAGEQIVPPLLCPSDEEELYPNLTEDDRLYLYCLSCNYKNYLGLEIYSKIEKLVLDNKNII